jgi:uncharacterized protein
MSAANASAPSPSIHEEMRAHEPSMEEILASIRRIIADDDSLPGTRREREERRRRDAEQRAADSTASPEPVVETPSQPAHVTQIMPLRLNRLGPEPILVDEPAVDEEEEADAEETSFSEAETIDYAADADDDEEAERSPLVSADAASSIASHFQALATSMFVNDSGMLQKCAQEMLRPMLKQWLDDNLPVIVERLVRAEIERVARGGRR